MPLPLDMVISRRKAGIYGTDSGRPPTGVLPAQLVTAGQVAGDVTTEVEVTVVAEQPDTPDTPPTGVEPDVVPYQSLHVDEVSRGSTGLAVARKLEQSGEPSRRRPESSNVP